MHTLQDISHSYRKRLNYEISRNSLQEDNATINLVMHCEAFFIFLSWEICAADFNESRCSIGMVLTKSLK